MLVNKPTRGPDDFPLREELVTDLVLWVADAHQKVISTFLR